MLAAQRHDRPAARSCSRSIGFDPRHAVLREELRSNELALKEGPVRIAGIQLRDRSACAECELPTAEQRPHEHEEIDRNRATVDTIIVTASNEIPINYKLRQRSAGWFVYDVEVENVSMVSSYRETYRSVVRRDGMDGLLEQMRERSAEQQL